MTTFDAKKLKKEYLDWYNQTLEFSNLSNNVVRIDTPFKDNSLDNLIIYALYDQSRDMITLTDDGYTIFDLENNGISLNKSKKRKKILKSTFQLTVLNITIKLTKFLFKLTLKILINRNIIYYSALYLLMICTYFLILSHRTYLQKMLQTNWMNITFITEEIYLL
ncbi:hypothetical protein EW35_2077 [Staphylococcus aureus]|nr:hypothetical protein EW35_2077 [Staphylococcus aureus]